MTIDIDMIDGKIQMYNGDVAFCDENREAEQSIEIRIKTIKGEYHLNLELGTDYKSDNGLLSAEVSNTERENIIRNKILEDPNIQSVVITDSKVEDNDFTVTCDIKTEWGISEGVIINV